MRNGCRNKLSNNSLRKRTTTTKSDDNIIFTMKQVLPGSIKDDELVSMKQSHIEHGLNAI
jgi:hypothetical protein